MSIPILRHDGQVGVMASEYWMIRVRGQSGTVYWTGDGWSACRLAATRYPARGAAASILSQLRSRHPVPPSPASRARIVHVRIRPLDTYLAGETKPQQSATSAGDLSALRAVLKAAEAVLARDDADAMVGLQAAVEACRGGTSPASAKPCGCMGDPVEHVMGCKGQPRAGAPERVWCEPDYDDMKDTWHWEIECGGWTPSKGIEQAIEYVRTDVADREREKAVRAAMEREDFA